MADDDEADNTMMYLINDDKLEMMNCPSTYISSFIRGRVQLRDIFKFSHELTDFDLSQTNHSQQICFNFGQIYPYKTNNMITWIYAVIFKTWVQAVVYSEKL